LGDFADAHDFTARVKILGPQWVTVADKCYKCYTPVQGSDIWFIARVSHDYRLFRVNPSGGQAEAILATDPPVGEVLQPGRHVGVESILQTLAEAWLFDPMQGALEDYANYLVTALPAGQLVVADDISADLMDLLILHQASTDSLRQFRNDPIRSPRLRAAWVDALKVLVAIRIDAYKSAK